uniref:Tetraspanin n=1 Tax=Eptatretus burgeri TaxID=7764 RepID=A0A8C4Q083_EPTBU
MTSVESIMPTCGYSYLVILVLVFWAAAAGIGYLGAQGLILFDRYSNFFPDSYTALPALLLISVASCLALVAVIGCCSSAGDSRFGASTFLFFLIAIFFFEVVAGVLAYAYRGQVNRKVSIMIDGVFQAYNGSSANTASQAVDMVQSQLHCCGIQNYTDWQWEPWFNHSGSAPLSCCAHNISICSGSLEEPTFLYHQGCQIKIVGAVMNALTLILWSAVAFGCFQLLAMVFTCLAMDRQTGDPYGFEPLLSTSLA